MVISSRPVSSAGDGGGSATFKGDMSAHASTSSSVVGSLGEVHSSKIPDASISPSPELKPLPRLPNNYGKPLQMSASYSSPSLPAPNQTLAKRHVNGHVHSPNVEKLQTPSLRQLILTSAASIHGSSEPDLHPLPPIASRAGLTRNLNPSENWTAPEDIEGAYIRKTYDWFDRVGVRGDGVLEGREWTREKGKKAAWEHESILCGHRRSGSSDVVLQRPSTSASTALQQTSRKRSRRRRMKQEGKGDAPMRPITTRDGRLSPAVAPLDRDEGGSPPLAPGPPRETFEILALHDSQRPPLPRAASASTIATHSEESFASSGEDNHDDPLDPEVRRVELEELEEGERQRAELFKRIDRYGFFRKDDCESGSRGRITIFTSKAFMTFPKKKGKVTSRIEKGVIRAKASASNSPTHMTFVLHSLPNLGKTGVPLEKEERRGGISSDPEEEAHIEAQDEDFGVHIYRQISARRSTTAHALRPKESLRIAKWARMLQVEGKKPNQNTFSYEFSDAAVKSEARRKRLKRRVYKGIPDRWRAAAWWAIMSEYEKGSGRPRSGRSSELYTATGRSSLLKSEEEYFEVTKRSSPHDVQIDLDVPRTISGHVLFHTRYGQGQRSLFHVLHALSLLCPECGYCQGMGPIAATLLVYLPPERAYACLVHMHDSVAIPTKPFSLSTSKYGLHETFSPGFPGLVENFFVQRSLCPSLGLGPVVEALDEQMISTSAYATKWYITLFANIVSFETQLRIWDAFFIHGKDLLVAVALAILWALRERIAPAAYQPGLAETATEGGGARFEDMLEALTAEFLLEDDDGLMGWVERLLARDDVIKTMSNARKQYQGRVERGEQPLL